MKYVNQLFFWALLAVCGMAHADTYVPMDPGAPGLFTNTWTFSSIPGVKGDFDESIIFNVPDTEVISFAAFGNSAGVSFIGGGFALSEAGPSGNLLALQFATNANAIHGGDWTLSSGTYVFEIAGTYLVDNASFTAVVTGIPPVPEPSSLMLLLAGLAMLATVTRARSRKG